MRRFRALHRQSCTPLQGRSKRSKPLSPSSELPRCFGLQPLGRPLDVPAVVGTVSFPLHISPFPPRQTFLGPFAVGREPRATGCSVRRFVVQRCPCPRTLVFVNFMVEAFLRRDSKDPTQSVKAKIRNGVCRGNLRLCVSLRRSGWSFGGRVCFFPWRHLRFARSLPQTGSEGVYCMRPLAHPARPLEAAGPATEQQWRWSSNGSGGIATRIASIRRRRWNSTCQVYWPPKSLFVLKFNGVSSSDSTANSSSSNCQTLKGSL